VEGFLKRFLLTKLTLANPHDAKPCHKRPYCGNTKVYATRYI